MVKKEYYDTRKDKINLYRIYSTENLYIRKIGTDEIYDEVIDVVTPKRTCTHTSSPL